ncbi:hypothetical protein BDN72DRAFT_834192 [Pluteus cervinus]|uniref:Uncharacterized protein n=1 Tax=Pluteus cervinus TaxID=181527 RepID=A0ACD3BA19_9AGAR|nr:hypothetical protein BDN72DRAFT_834192 [Pluteus cervinus]
MSDELMDMDGPLHNPPPPSPPPSPPAVISATLRDPKASPNKNIQKRSLSPLRYVQH